MMPLRSILLPAALLLAAVATGCGKSDETADAAATQPDAKRKAPIPQLDTTMAKPRRSKKHPDDW